MNLELIKEAYAIIDGIPSKQFDLDRWVRDNDNSATCDLAGACGTVACAGGWLSLHPKMNEHGLKYTWSRGLGRGNNERRITFKGDDWGGPFDALAKAFDIGYFDARRLFGARGSGDYDHRIFTEKGYDISHKQLFKYRVKHFLKDNDPTYTKRIYR